MIKMKELIKQQTDMIRKASGMNMINEATYVAGKLPTLFKFAKQYLFEEGSIGNPTFWHKWTIEGFTQNVTESFSVKQGINDGTIKSSDVTKFVNNIKKAFTTMRRDVEKAHAKWEKSIEKATKPFDKEYTGV